MKLASVVKIASPIKVVQNSPRSVGVSTAWGQIRSARTNKILHTGQLRYIKRVARERYNTQVRFL